MKLDYDEDDLVDWDVGFAPPSGTSQILKGTFTFLGWAPIPEWSEEDLEADLE